MTCKTPSGFEARFTVTNVLAWFKRGALCAGLVATGVPAHAGLFDTLFGRQPAAQQAKVDPAQRTWSMGEFNTLQLVPREPGAAENQHPLRVGSDVLRWQLAGVRVIVDGKSVALLSGDEVNEIAEPLAQALAVAGPGDDVVLLSTSRRGATFLTTATGVTARLFVQDGSLQLIVRDARLEFIKDYINSRSAPSFNYGSRSTAGNATLANSAATNRRADWLALPLTMPGAAAAVVAQPAPATANRAAPAVAAAPALEPLQTEAEHRLATLKRLRDRGLISEEEFQEKRKEVLKQL